MTQNDFNFLQEACIGKLDALLKEIVENNRIANEVKAKDVENEKEEQKENE